MTLSTDHARYDLAFDEFASSLQISVSNEYFKASELNAAINEDEN